MKFVTVKRLEQLIAEARANNVDSSKYEHELAELKAASNETTSEKARCSKSARGHTMTQGNIRIYSMAKVDKSHFRGLEK